MTMSESSALAEERTSTLAGMNDLRDMADFLDSYFTANAAAPSAYTICSALPQHHQRILYVVHFRSTISVYYM